MISVLVVATDLIVRAGLESILHASPDLSVYGGIASDADTLSAMVAGVSPDVVLIELGRQDDEPVSDKLVALNTLAGVAIVILADTPPADWTTEALRLGVRAVLPRSATAEEILQTVVAAAAGLVVLHPEVVDALLPVLPSATRVDVADLVQALTGREIEVLGMIAQGLGNKAIARRLSISEHTVKFHVSSIFTKLNARSRTEAVTLGARQGLIML